LAIPEVDVVPDVNSSMTSALDTLISLSRSGDDGDRIDDDCGGVGNDGNDGNDFPGDPTPRIISVVR
jgi:hypothetical protein